jgi:deoxyribodipyrimidine photolyase-related protein
MAKVTLIFPHQLFESHPALAETKKVFLIEAKRFFTDFTYHKNKLLLHRASMQAYYQSLREKGHDVTYVPFHKDIAPIFAEIGAKNKAELITVDPVDIILESTIRFLAKKNNLPLTILPSPAFLTPNDWLKIFFQKKNYLLKSFYIAQRKRMNIMIDQDGKPAGGKWSYDSANRKKLPTGLSVPKLTFFGKNKWVSEAKNYIAKHFPINPGTIEQFIYPVTFSEVLQWFDEFLTNRLKLFGTYEDAMHNEEVFLFHSVLSPLLNIGLITPETVINKVLIYAKKHTIPINSLEGFIRQIIGWREFIRAMYLFEGEKERTSNFWSFDKKMPKSIYQVKTNVAPVDIVLQKVMKNAYCHHIERLMILGNYFLLCEIHPEEVYKWFMEMFIDAYDWVMVPNVFGMSQYADGGLFATKPYISSSNYIRKMSNYKKDSWCTIFDGLFWRFIQKYQDILEQNPRMVFMTRLLKRMSDEKRKAHLAAAEKYLEKLS